MPIRHYFCRKCDHKWNELKKISDPDPEICESCSSSDVGTELAAPAIGSGGKILPEFNVGFNPAGKTNEERFTVTERTPSNAKEIAEKTYEQSKNTKV